MLENIFLNGKRYQYINSSIEGREIIINLPEGSILLDIDFHPEKPHVPERFTYKYLEPVEKS